MDSPKTGLKAFGEHVAAALESETQPGEQIDLARSRLLEQVTSGSGGERAARYRYAGLAAAGALGIALALGIAVWRAPEAPLSFETRAGELHVGDVLEAAAADPMHVSFSEGSSMVLHGGARARVLDTEPRGARVLLEEGGLDVAVVHRDKTRWRFEAGPFQVLVKGTAFQLDWEPGRELLSLQMKTGLVEVSGSCLRAPRRVEGGASLRLSCAELDAAAAAPASAPRVEGPTGDNHEVAPAAQPSPPSGKAARAARPEPRAAEPSFEERCLTAGRDELVALANRERLAGRATRAQHALLALRKRFPDSREAATAAFTLGRIAFEQQADYARAAKWFSSYLAEQPNGPLMGDAAGRLVEAHERRGDRAAARRAAETYLERFPDGPYSGKAKRILAE